MDRRDVDSVLGRDPLDHGGDGRRRPFRGFRRRGWLALVRMGLAGARSGVERGKQRAHVHGGALLDEDLLQPARGW